MKFRLERIIYIILLLIIVPSKASQNIAGSLGDDQQQLNYIRDYMATHRIFDRLDFLPARNSFRRANILGKIRQGEQASKQILWLIQREYPLYTINQHLMAYTIPLGLLLWNQQYLWQWFLAMNPESKMILTVIPAVLLIDQISTVCSQIYYVTLPPSILETDLI